MGLEKHFDELMGEKVPASPDYARFGGELKPWEFTRFMGSSLVVFNDGTTREAVEWLAGVLAPTFNLKPYELPDGSWGAKLESVGQVSQAGISFHTVLRIQASELEIKQ